MYIYGLLELSVYLILFPVIYKVVIAIDLTNIFKKNRVTEIKLFYLLLIIALTKLIGDFITMFMDYIRLLLDIGL